MYNRTKGRLLFEVFLYIGFTVFALVIVYPFWHILVSSITSYNAYVGRIFQIIPKDITFQAYRIVFEQENIGRSFLITVIVAVIGTLISVTVTTMAAYSLSKKNLKGSRFIIGIFLFTMVFSGGIIPLYFVLRNLSLLNSIWSMMLPPLMNVFYFVIMRTNFISFPESLEESAKIEGCNEIQILLKIVIPLSMPIIATISLFYAVDRWNDFFLAMLFINNRDLYPLQYVVYRLVVPGQMLVQSNASYLASSKVVLVTIRMASVVIAAAPILIVYPFVQKYFTKGVMLGAIKG